MILGTAPVEGRISGIGPFTSFDPVGFAIFATLLSRSRYPRAIGTALDVAQIGLPIVGAHEYGGWDVEGRAPWRS
jgi:hypothetical protein